MRREAGHLRGAFTDAYADYERRVPLFWPRPPSGRRSDVRGRWEQAIANREHWTVLGSLVVALLIGWKLFQ